MSEADPITGGSWPPLVRQILVVDGDESVVASVRKLVTPFPCRVDSAGDDSDADAMIGDASRDQRYDIIIADLHFSFNSGSALLPLMEAEGSRLPIVLTIKMGFDPALWIVKARHLGLRAFLFKPFRAEQLFNAICQVIDDSQRTQAEIPEPRP